MEIHGFDYFVDRENHLLTVYGAILDNDGSDLKTVSMEATYTIVSGDSWAIVPCEENCFDHRLNDKILVEKTRYLSRKPGGNNL